MPKNLLLFDIDATLLLTGGAGMRAMAMAARDLFGDAFQWDGIEPSGSLDPLIFAEAVERSRLELEAGAHERFRGRYLELLEAGLRDGRAAVRAMPGVHEILADLRRREDIVLGLLTGNYSHAARLKLQAVGIDPAWFPIGVFGDEAGSRPALVALALRKFEVSHGALEPGRVIVIGDTPRDVEGAIANGCLALAVATGKYSLDELVAAGATAAVQDLTDPRPLFELLGVGLV